MKRLNSSVDAAISEVRAAYREVDARPAERNCLRRTECCQFNLTWRTPFLTRGEALVAAKALRATGRTQLPSRADGACPLLEPASGRCIIYEHRPFGCRTHFCAAAGGPYARREVADLIQRLERIDHDLGGNGAHDIESAVTAALHLLR